MVNEPSAPPPPGPQPIAASDGRFPWKVVLAILIIAGVATFALLRQKKQAVTQTKGPGGKGGAALGPVSAVIGVVHARDVPIFLDGLGTVQAFNTVTVRSRVEGNLTKIQFREGQDVKAGDVLAQIDPDPFKSIVQQTEAKKAQDEALLENARVELRRDASLLESKIVSQEIYDAQQAQVRQLEAAVKSDEASAQSARIQLGYTTITAPIDGRTGIRLIDEGNVIRTGDSNGIVTLIQLRPISMIFTLPEQSLKQIQSHKNPGEMTVLAVDRDNTTVLDTGKLAVVDNQIDTATGTIKLKASFPNADLKLWPGQFVNSRLLLEVRTNSALVPASVVQRGPDGPYAFVVDKDMTARMVPIKVTQIEDGEALIESGLKPGDQVVVDGQYKLQPGSKVKPSQPDGADVKSTNAPTGRPGKNRSKSRPE